MLRRMKLVCLLRGINVSGKNLIKMEALRESFGALGLGEVRTYVQSGNIVFEAKSAAGLVDKIRKRIVSDFGCEVPVLVLSASDLRTIVDGNPFLKERGIDPTKLHVTFLDGEAGRPALAALAAIPAGEDRFHPTRKALYLHTPGGYGVTKLSNTAIERALGTTATTRNWKTVTTLAAMLE